MSILTPKIHLTNPEFKYIPSAKTDITRTFARIRKELKNQDSKEPVIAPILNPNGFVLSAQWFEMLE